MKPLLIGAAVVASLHGAGAVAQHHAQPQAGAAKAAPKVEARAEPKADAGGGTLYRSPFAGYRPFTAEEPVKDWKQANDEVRDAGGHVGLLKGEPAQLKGHGSHGAKQPAPPVQEKK